MKKPLWLLVVSLHFFPVHFRWKRKKTEPQKSTLNVLLFECNAKKKTAVVECMPSEKEKKVF